LKDKRIKQENNKKNPEKQSIKGDTVVDGKNKEIGGRKGPEPTRYGDWEKNGRCIDF